MKKEKRKLNKFKISILTIIIILLITVAVFGRYITNNIRDMYTTSKEFYFSSDKLDINTPVYNINNWSGLGNYEINFDLLSRKNDLEKLEYDLNYQIECQGGNNKIDYKINNQEVNTTYNGTIYKTTNSDRAKILFIPKGELKKGDKIEITVIARTSEPFKKEIKAKYNIEIANENLSFAIEDVKNRNYATLFVTNSKHSDNTLSLEFDPNIVRIDLNNKVIKESIEYKTIAINGEQYINKMKVRLPKESSGKIKFYKVDKAQNYTYPNTTNECIVKITEEK